jgi:hypothetical protein
VKWSWFPHWLLTVLIVVIVVIILAIVIGALGGFEWVLRIGHFHLDIGVSKGA